MSARDDPETAKVWLMGGAHEQSIHVFVAPWRDTIRDVAQTRERDVREAPSAIGSERDRDHDQWDRMSRCFVLRSREAVPEHPEASRCDRDEKRKHRDDETELPVSIDRKPMER